MAIRRGVFRLPFLLAFAATVAATLPARAEPVRYEIDPEHLSIGFLVHHIGFAKVLGMFRAGEGSFVFDAEARTVRDIDVVVHAASVFTNHEARDDHLLGPDFLWAKKHPRITFAGTSAEPTGERTGLVTGDLAIRGVARPATLEVVWNKTGNYPFGPRHEAIGISARTVIKRSDFGMAYAVANGWVGDEVEILIEFEAKRAD